MNDKEERQKWNLCRGGGRWENLIMTHSLNKTPEKLNGCILVDKKIYDLCVEGNLKKILEVR